MAVDGVHPEDVLRRVGVPRRHRTSVDGEPSGVVPRAAVDPEEPGSGQHVGVALDRGDLARSVPAPRVAAGGEMTGVDLGRGQVGR